MLVLGCVGGVSCAHLPADAPGRCCAFGLCWAVVVVVVALLVGARSNKPTNGHRNGRKRGFEPIIIGGGANDS